MALETFLFPNNMISGKDLYHLEDVNWSYGFGVKEEEGIGDDVTDEKNIEEDLGLLANQDEAPYYPQQVPATNASRKQRRTRNSKNKEEVETQRRTHIVVERNRRKQMNDYLTVLRSLMPPSYIHKSDQASIIGGAINFVKELEQMLQSLEARRKIKTGSNSNDIMSSSLTDFFTFPQYFSSCTSNFVAKNHSLIADIEVTMFESHANLKVLTKTRAKQTLKMVSEFQCLRLTILHMNVTTVDQTVIYSFSVKVEDDCQLKSVDEIATSVHQILRMIQEEITSIENPY